MLETERRFSRLCSKGVIKEVRLQKKLAPESLISPLVSAQPARTVED